MAPPPAPPPAPQPVSHYAPGPMMANGSAGGSGASAGVWPAGNNGAGPSTPGAQAGGGGAAVGGGPRSPPVGVGVADAAPGEPAGPADLLSWADLDAAVLGSLDPGMGSEPRTVRLERPPDGGQLAAEAMDQPTDDCCEHRQALVQGMALGEGQHLFLPEDMAPADIPYEQACSGAVYGCGAWVRAASRLAAVGIAMLAKARTLHVSARAKWCFPVAPACRSSAAKACWHCSTACTLLFSWKARRATRCSTFTTTQQVG